MKNNKHIKSKLLTTIPFIALTAIGMCGALTSCSDDNVNGKTENAENILDQIPLPTADQLSEKYNEKAVIIGSDRSDLNACLVNRMQLTSNTISADAKAIIFTKNHNAKLSTSDIENLIKAYNNNASVIIVEPASKKDNADLAQQITVAFKELEAKGVNTDDAHDLAFRIKNISNSEMPNISNHVDAIAIRKHALYIMRDLDEQADSAAQNITLSQTDEQGNTTETKVEGQDYTPTAYQYGQSADMLVKWLKEADTDEQSLKAHRRAITTRSISTQLEELMSAQKVTIHECVGPSRVLERTMNYELNFYIYPTHKFDTNEDYYFIRLEPKFHASELGCPTGQRDWIKASKEPYDDSGSNYWNENSWYGPYMRKSLIKVSLDTKNNEEVSVLEARPTTTTDGSHSYTSGTSFSLGGDIGLSTTGPSGGINASVSMSQSYSHSEPNLTITHSDYGKNTTEWLLDGIKPAVHNDIAYIFGAGRLHDLVATFQRSDWSADLTWIYVVKNPAENQSYELSVIDNTEIAELNHSIRDYELAVHPWQAHKIFLAQPNRAKKDYVMLCSNEKLYKNILTQIGADWQSDFTYYAPIQSELDPGAIRMFNRVMNTISNMADNLYEQGYKDTYTFRLRSKDSSADIASFTLQNGKVISSNNNAK